MKAGRAFAAALLLGATAASAQVWRSDQGNGSFRNPVLFADYPDPDIIRVGTDYYLVTADVTITLLTLDAALAHVTDARTINDINSAEESQMHLLIT